MGMLPNLKLSVNVAAASASRAFWKAMVFWARAAQWKLLARRSSTTAVENGPSMGEAVVGFPNRTA